MPESSLWLGDMCLAFCTVPFVFEVHKTALTACPRTVPQCWAMQKGIGFGQSAADSTALAALHTLSA